ncbi:MAG: hypothetical protein AAF408_02145, partial [Pseudomonadota bacterium]
HNQIGTDYYYNATPGAAQRDIKTSVKLYDALLRLRSGHAALSPEEFQTAYNKTLIEVQGGLGDTGFGPVANLATEQADLNRAHYSPED